MYRAVLLSAVLIGAGCLGVPGSESETETDPPDATWAEGEHLNTSALATSHFTTLRDAGSFSVNRSDTIRIDGEARPEGPRPEGYYPPSMTHRQVDLADGRYLDRHVTVGHRRSSHFISPKETARKRQPCASDCAVEYNYDRRTGDAVAERLHRFRTQDVVNRLARMLRGGTVEFTYNYTGTVTRDGETLYRYRASQDLSRAPPPFADPPRGTATLLITDEGVIRMFELRYVGAGTVTVDGEERSVNVTQTFVRQYTDVGGTDVERPGWVAEAAEAAGQRTTATAASTVRSPSHGGPPG